VIYRALTISSFGYALSVSIRWSTAAGRATRIIACHTRGDTSVDARLLVYEGLG